MLQGEQNFPPLAFLSRNFPEFTLSLSLPFIHSMSIFSGVVTHVIGEIDSRWFGSYHVHLEHGLSSVLLFQGTCFAWAHIHSLLWPRVA